MRRATSLAAVVGLGLALAACKPYLPVPGSRPPAAGSGAKTAVAAAPPCDCAKAQAPVAAKPAAPAEAQPLTQAQVDAIRAAAAHPHGRPYARPQGRWALAGAPARERRIIRAHAPRRDAPPPLAGERYAYAEERPYPHDYQRVHTPDLPPGAGRGVYERSVERGQAYDDNRQTYSGQTYSGETRGYSDTRAQSSSRYSQSGYGQEGYVQRGYVQGGYAQGGYDAYPPPPPPPPIPTYAGGYRYSTARAYTVSQPARGDVGRSRAWIRTRCPEDGR